MHIIHMSVAKTTSRLKTTSFCILSGLLLLLGSTAINAAPTAYTDEAEFHSALALLGHTATHEGFEDDAAWGGVRTNYPGGFNAAASVSSLGMTWTSNSQLGQVTTGGGAGRTGFYGFYSYPHGSYGSPDPGMNCTLPGECGDGWRGTADSGMFIAMGGYIDTNTPYTSLGMFLGQYPDNPVDFGETCDANEMNCYSNSIVGTALKFFGVIDPDGFAAFEYRDTEGTAEDSKYLFSDDFYFVIIPPPPVPVPAVLVSPTAGLITTEAGGSAAINVVLATQPSANVEITLASSDTDEGVISPAVMTFTSFNWDDVQVGTISGQDDVVTDGNVAYDITVAVAGSADTDYAVLSPQQVAVTNLSILNGDLQDDDSYAMVNGHVKWANTIDNSHHIVTAFNTSDTALLDGFVLEHGNALGAAVKAGGALMINGASPKIKNVWIKGSGAAYIDSTLMVTFSHSTFIHNLADHGGALVLSGTSSLIGNTFTANYSEKDGGGIYVNVGDVTLVNNILWGNTIEPIDPEEDQVPIAKVQLHNNGGVVAVSYGILEGLYQVIIDEDPTDPTKYPGVRDADPLFEDADGADNTLGNEDDDLRPGTDSPAIDAGDNSAVPAGVLTDINGNPRFTDDLTISDAGIGTAPLVDMGAYERTCSASKSMPDNQWATFSLPCAPADRTVASVFTGGLSMLEINDYNVRWVVYVYENFDNTPVGGYPQGYTRLAVTDQLVAGKGYFYYALDESTISVSGIFNSGADIALRAQQADGIYNLVGNPHPVAVAWSDVLVDVAGSVYSLAEADPAYECDTSPAPASCKMWHVLNKWESSSYVPYDGNIPTAGTLDPFDAVWVRAHGAGIALRIPAPVMPAFVQAPTAMAAKLNLRSVVEGQAVDKNGGKGQPWYIRLVAEAGSYRDSGNWLGQLEGVKDKWDSRDLEEFYPQGEPYLSILFTNPKLDEVAWGYTTDYRKLTKKQKGEWPFVVRASGGIHEVTLSWQGDANLFDHAVLIDEFSGEVIPVFPGGSYSFSLSGSEHAFCLVFD